MSTRIIGRLADEQREGLIGFRVSLRLPGSLFDYDGTEIGHVVTKAGEDGRFEFTYRRDVAPAPFHRELELIVQDGVGRVLRFATESGREILEDVDDEILTRAADFVIRDADARGLLVTLGSGEVRNFSSGNRVTLLMDQDAFAHAAAMIDGAQESIQMSQLFFALPVGFEADATLERAKLIFDFHRPDGEPLDLDNPRAAGVGDARPERLLLDAADRGVDIKVLLHAFTVPLFIRIIAGALVFPFAGTDGVQTVAGEWLGSDLTDTDEARRYFDKAGRAKIKVQAFEQSVLSAGVMHAKLMVVDGRHALSIGSPFGQSYVDSFSHRIDAWIRGDTEGLPKHDAGFGVSGPALHDLYAAFRLLWNTAAPDEQLPQQPTEGSGSQLELPPEDAVCAMQIVRTLSTGEPLNLGDGEKGILEAYLRAIAAAQDFIYLETQYFTNDAIGHALVEAMKRNSGLQVIVLLNIEPDVPTYPFKQRRLITRIRKGIGQTAEGPQRFGVFTRWTHEIDSPAEITDPRPRMVPVYIHAKVGIVDNSWATVGSANLDGLSLDSSLPSDIFRDLFNMGEQRAIEVNAIMLNNEAHPSAAVDILRRKLWAEHLGYETARDVLDIGAEDLNKRPAGGWLELWTRRAKATLEQLVERPSLPTTAMGRVLPWPDEDTTYKTPRKHLDALGIRSHAVVPLKSTRAFDFETGTWKKDSKAKMDYP